MRKRSLILVEWEDIATYNSWRDEGKTKEVEPMLCQTVGWKMKAPSPKKIAIASTRSCQDQCSDMTIIPKSNVKSIRRLEKCHSHQRELR